MVMIIAPKSLTRLSRLKVLHAMDKRKHGRWYGVPLHRLLLFDDCCCSSGKQQKPRLKVFFLFSDTLGGGHFNVGRVAMLESSGEILGAY